MQRSIKNVCNNPFNCRFESVQDNEKDYPNPKWKESQDTVVSYRVGKTYFTFLLLVYTIGFYFSLNNLGMFNSPTYIS